jgi:hypothetical protein
MLLRLILSLSIYKINIYFYSENVMFCLNYINRNVNGF